ncbi:MAG: FAD-dependent 5-carboxymethylaminomethyl-2-thiouridine(34) oxidoreductase MnmC [Aquabacterium sp.]|uniref:FAD-dependent 5-carboxymethylaminomethyl-2-thiouridine(34) oxidoreductase MnmC n=1 Tax=Aquabacterium sp. TaxID=1872578 RepID=UPI001B506DFA|nr:FAD-dependent 5-carboxymethylaminomethyl-2-thiouridine(34) oxidoreductase MnmC [Aquabacterium sp.]MBP7132814.1 FAD-dependent 5-carboxymethylaminomethyl-2-thiouridine(34) oxidoreductase MnmC [Aquabacterium sp.]
MTISPAELGQSPNVHRPTAVAWEQAQHVFVQGNGLPGRWQHSQRFVILETGFGLGHQFLATWAAWRADPDRCDRLVFISIEKHPVMRPDLARAHGLDGATPAYIHPDHLAVTQRLLPAWPDPTPGWHTLHFDEPVSASGRLQGVTLQLGLGDAADLLPTLVAQVDAFYLDGFAPDGNPERQPSGWLSRLNRLAAPGATAAAWCADQSVRADLTHAGFTVEGVPGLMGESDMMRAHYAPRYTPSPLPGGVWPQPAPESRHALVVGAGLAGASAAWALCRQGWRVTVVDQQDGPAQGTSGNAGGLFHSVLHAQDSHHARLHRAAALATWRQVRPWIESGRLAGQCDGLLRLDDDTDAEQARAQLSRLGVSPEHVAWLDQTEARSRAGLDVPSGGWLFQQGGWLQPGGYVRCLLDEAASLRDEHGPLLTCLWQTEVSRLQRDQQGKWHVLGATGETVAQAPTLVLACAHQSTTLLQTLPSTEAVPAVTMTRLRGQVTQVPATTAHAAFIRQPKLPVAGNGYVVPLPDGGLLCGATVKRDDEDASVRPADHLHNLTRAHRLGAWLAPVSDDASALPSDLLGRTGWRAVSPDRLPMVGALPWSDERLAAQHDLPRLDQVRMVPRERQADGGLYIATGLGSRGITWTALIGELVAHWVTGSPCPIEVDLRDAMDPGRFQVRARRT